MAKVIVVYESKYGNTKRAAETIIEGMKEISGIEAVLSEPKAVDLSKLADFDAIVIGSPIHAGSATRGIRKFVGNLGKFKLDGKLVAIFDLHMSPESGRVVGKLEKQIGEKAPGLKIAVPGLSIRVKGLKGPISEGELPRCKEFGSKIASQLKG